MGDVGGDEPVKKAKNVTPRFKKTQQFTGCSPFDFAMRQKAAEKERREKQRLAKEALSTHHAGSAEHSKAAKKKAEEDGERKKRKEAEENLNTFKAAEMDQTAQAAADIKKQQLQEKQAKKRCAA